MIEVLKQALEALEINLIFLRNVKPFKGQKDLASDCVAMTEETITSLRQAIREHAMYEVQRLGQEIEQEPVGWLDSNDKLAEFMHKDLKAEHDKCGSATPRMFSIPVYTHPPKVEQEPVAWRAPNWGHSADEYVYRDFDDLVIGVDGKPSPNNEPLYTHPPQRKPLTDEQIEKLMDNYDVASLDYARAIEAAHGIKEES